VNCPMARPSKPTLPTPFPPLLEVRQWPADQSACAHLSKGFAMKAVTWHGKRALNCHVTVVWTKGR